MQRVETWAQYVRRASGTAKHHEIAEKTGIAASNVGRWLRGEPGLPRAESVVAFARAYKRPPVEALVAAGYLTVEESASKSRTPLDQYSSDELFAELRRRVAASD